MLNGVGQAMIAVVSVGLLARHTAAEERGRAYAAHFALTHLCWLGTYPAVGYLGRAVGVPATFTVAGVVVALATLSAVVLRPSTRGGAYGVGQGSRSAFGGGDSTGAAGRLPARACALDVHAAAVRRGEWAS